MIEDVDRDTQIESSKHHKLVHFIDKKNFHRSSLVSKCMDLSAILVPQTNKVIVGCGDPSLSESCKANLNMQSLFYSKVRVMSHLSDLWNIDVCLLNGLLYQIFFFQHATQIEAEASINCGSGCDLHRCCCRKSKHKYQCNLLLP